MSEQNMGTVVQIIGPVLDIKFAADALPKLLNAITIDNHGRIITVEVAQHIGQDTVRCIAMESTDGLVRGMKAVDTGGPITVPVGDKNLGRIFNLLGQPVDNKPPVEGEERWPIHRPAPSYEEQESTTEILETGAKANLLLKEVIGPNETQAYSFSRAVRRTGSQHADCLWHGQQPQQCC